MSIIASIKQKLGLSVTPANNFTWDASADNGTLKLARGNPGATTQDILTVNAAGKVDLAALARDFTSNNGSLELPSGLIIKWGNANSSAGSLNFGFATAFPTACFQVVATCATTANVVAVINTLSASSVTVFTHVGSTGAAASVPVRLIAVGY